LSPQPESARLLKPTFLLSRPPWSGPSRKRWFANVPQPIFLPTDSRYYALPSPRGTPIICAFHRPRTRFCTPDESRSVTLKYCCLLFVPYLWHEGVVLDSMNSGNLFDWSSRFHPPSWSMSDLIGSPSVPWVFTVLSLVHSLRERPPPRPNASVNTGQFCPTKTFKSPSLTLGSEIPRKPLSIDQCVFFATEPTCGAVRLGPSPYNVIPRTDSLFLSDELPAEHVS